MDRSGQPPDVRLAGALAWLCATQARPPAALLDLLTTLAGAPAAQWLQDVPWPDDIDHHGGLAAWLVSFLGEEPEVQARLTTSLITQPDHIVAASACRAAHDVARVWRTRTEEVLGLLAGCLDHPDRTVRMAAIRLLARGGDVPAQAADKVAAVLDDDDPEPRAWAAAILAHRGDARAIAPLTALLTRTECPWPCAWTTSSAPPQRLLDMLGPYADALLPAVMYRIAQPGTGCWRYVPRDLLHGLATWHNQAADAAAALTDLLVRPGEDQHTITTILGRIGPAATIAVPVLDELLVKAATELVGVLAWARWRITGERTAQTAQTLALMAGTPPHGPEGLRLLADLGPAAAAHASMIRARLTDSYEWIRAEAAHALWRCTGDTADTVPVLVRLFDGYPYLPMFAPVHSVAVECLGHIGAPAEPAAPILIDYLEADQRRDRGAQRHDPISWDQHGQRLAAAALSRIRPPDPKTSTLAPRASPGSRALTCHRELACRARRISTERGPSADHPTRARPRTLVAPARQHPERRFTGAPWSLSVSIGFALSVCLVCSGNSPRLCQVARQAVALLAREIGCLATDGRRAGLPRASAGCGESLKAGLAGCARVGP